MRFDRTPEGVVTMTLHTEGDSMMWTPGNARDEIAFAFSDVAGDPEVEVLILTGAGDNFIVEYSYGESGEPVPAGRPLNFSRNPAEDVENARRASTYA
ncbi:hypothetical protein [Streptomyces rameus]